MAVAAMLFAFLVGAIGNVAGAAIAGTELVWDVSLGRGALVAYFVYSLLMPTVSGILASNQDWFRDLQPWVDLNYAQAGPCSTVH